MVFLPSALALLAFTASVLGAEPTPYQTLPPAPKYSHGAFTSPNTTQNQIYAEGLQMNITWQTDFNAVNIDLIKSLNFNSKVTIATATSQKWVLYNIECIDKQCNISHHFRLTNAYGDPAQGQVWSGAFWIKPSSDNTPTTSSSSSSSSTSNPTSSSSTPSDLPTLTAASSSTSPTSTSSPSNTLALGLGIGLGLGLPLLAILSALLYFFRRRRNQRGGVYSKAAFAETPSTFEHNGGNHNTAGGGTDAMGYYSPMEFAKYEHRASPQTGRGGVAEVPAAREPGELEGSEVLREGERGK